MIATIPDSRRITIPKQIFDQSNLPLGTKVDITFDGEKFLLTPVLETNKNNEVKKDFFVEKPKIESKNKSNNSESKKREIVSNLEQGLSYKKQYFSKCGLVIRTKNKYLKDFCNDCKGKLVDDYNLEIEKCCNYRGNRLNQFKKVEHKTQTPVIKDRVDTLRKTKKILIDNINENKKQIEQKIDKDIEDTLDFEGSKVLQPIWYDGYKSCTNCRTLCENGFLVNNKFYCRSCTLEDFKKYYNKKKGMNVNV